MKFRTDEAFLFPASQLDFKRDHINFPAGALHGFGALNGAAAFEAAIRAQTAKFNYQLKKATQEEWLAAAGAVPADITDAELEKAIRIGYEYAVNGQAAGDAMRAAEEQNIQAAAAQQASNAAATAAAQAQAQQAARQAAALAESAARRADEQAQAEAVAKAAAATKNAMAVQAVIDAQLKAQQAAAAAAAAQPAPTAKEVKAATDTQKTVVDTTSATVKTVDTASGTTSTVNAATGSVRLTLSDGTTTTGTGTVTAGGVTTVVDTKTGVVTTQNANTGVATQTNATTGQTQTAVQVTGTAATGGTFILPDGKTVTTTKPITATALSPGHIALAALVGILLLRGAIK
jgi:hypothetical protein